MAELSLLDGFCRRLNAMGFALLRASVGSAVLHPTLTGRAFIWERDRGARREDLVEEAGVARTRWQKSPFYHMLETGEFRFRRRLDATLERDRFPILEELRARGARDYIATGVRFGDGAAQGELRGILCSLATDRPGGFDDDRIALAARLADHFGLAFKAAASISMARTLIATYLGADVQRRILSGQVRRGHGETVDAILWHSDLRGFTRLTDTAPVDEVIDLLDAYAECLIEIIHGRGGEVLKFIGDGLLAMFPADRPERACARALDAAFAASHAVDALADHRAGEGKPATGFYLGLHRGRVLYGNIGSATRLDFTVIGRAVNEVTRIGEMCRALDQTVIVSQAFHEAAGPAAGRLVALGRHALRGVARPQRLFTLDHHPSS
ncbi:MAG: adenylate/guanylate cyclase domain-containing protein [Geminicoccaceae bacterium]|nr:adenylate/guanylate cyclase domain-containing protein [Geminicoccaceae bacterium]